MIEERKIEPIIEEMLSAGAHFGYNKSRRHPSVKKYIFTVKDRGDIVDLEKTKELLEKAKTFLKELAKSKKTILLVGTKPEAKKEIKTGAENIKMPYVIERWIGGTITNFPQIRKRIDIFEDLKSQKEKGELDKYTKKERLLIDRKIDNLAKNFSGLVSLKKIPDAIFIIDSKHEKSALSEAKKGRVPIVSLSNSDCNIMGIDYPIIGNDSSTSSIAFMVNQLVKTYREGMEIK